MPHVGQGDDAQRVDPDEDVVNVSALVSREKRALAATLVTACVGLAPMPARADDPVDPPPYDTSPMIRREAMANLHLVDVRLAAGGALESGDVVGGLAFGERAGVHLAAGLSIASTEVLGGGVRAISADVAWNEATGRSVVGAELFSLDALMLGADHRGVCPAPIFVVWPPSLCSPQSGYVGVRGSLVGYQHDFVSDRNALRVGQLGLVLAVPYGDGTGAFGDDWLVARAPIHLGASVDYVWNLRGSTASEAWLARADLGVDVALRLFDTRFELELALDYRPRFDAFVDDYGVEATLRVAYIDLYTLLRAQSDLVRFGLEVGYAHWSDPSHSFGTAWSDQGTDSGFVRLVLLPTLRNVP